MFWVILVIIIALATSFEVLSAAPLSSDDELLLELERLISLLEFDCCLSLLLERDWYARVLER